MKAVIEARPALNPLEVLTTRSLTMARILIVDDDPALLRLLSLRLHYEGHTVIEASSGALALSKLDHEIPHIVITDLRMPGMDGLQLFEAVHRRYPLLPVLISASIHGSISTSCSEHALEMEA